MESFVIRVHTVVCHQIKSMLRNLIGQVVLLLALLPLSLAGIAQPLPSLNTPAQNALGLEQTIGDVQLRLIGEHNYQLLPIGINELNIETQQRSSDTSATGIAVVQGNQLTVNFTFPDNSPPPAFLSRRIERIWRVTAQPDQTLSYPPVNIQWDGTDQSMTASDGGRSLPVTLVPFVQDEGIEESTGLHYWEGGVQLQVPTEQLRGEVRYSGRLLIFMESF